MEITQCELPGLRKIASGKVREIFDLGDKLLFVATDRISAFDCILPNPIPGKGEVLTQISAFWFSQFNFVENHMVTADFDAFPDEVRELGAELRGRSMIVRKARPLPIECVVRGYLAGSGWKEYKATGAICGERLPSGLNQASRLPRTIFTPSTKAVSGHDINIGWEACCEMVGRETATRARELSIQIYEAGREHAQRRGIIVADTKFEFGLLDDKLILIDECLTPDSSRFWPADRYSVGYSPPSFDKQFVRDYLEALDWEKTPPAPSLPVGVVRKTSEKYREAFTRLTGEGVAG
ncbi:MAG: phosphoribosylaminoimidazole-succinocarboxamide synthase [Chthoniobacter sp.]|jgi:phosphoribosylaminoimidazole-succinocarboxamide synthase|nr:phosphoribosylaminoimidazole-succinocarboxamide synthase [Chthoniobacter sp.]